MLSKANSAVLGFVLFAAVAVFAQTAAQAPQYTDEAQLRLPQHYRAWIFLSAGFDMSYDPAAKPRDQHLFDNVFVNPEAFRAFQNTGTWPDKTVFVLELRRADSKGSINQSGSYQAGAIVNIEVHVKDSVHFPGGWAFFGFGPSAATAKLIPQTQNCYSCHAMNGAVDTTFVQFYPTLLPIARAKGTLSPGYRDEGASTK